ncbi:carbohydrate ABC transporter permease [Pararobbsia silviterrae]|uniref:sn-glycerol-3-phosphate transport system permease protein UgpE n=1 Tax=Pararobbsia silviterrae TaxID=1792498 RepID=A0A494XUU2_9BURK|nr:carbohydrate ABC transporter permease [Pararobbsia silviterrae]RKP51839.1 carbohydrate ABC transporter permease [Pararobbsia silviterrae]
MAHARRSYARLLATHAVLLFYTLISIGPIVLIAMNSIKSRSAIFSAPLAWPSPSTVDFSGYAALVEDGSFAGYFLNSTVVTVTALIAVIVFGAMAAFALSEYRFKLNALTGLYFAIGIMIPIRLGTVGILEMLVAAHLANTLTGLILVYTAQGLPLAIFILTEYMKTVSSDLKNAGRIDGLSEYRIFFWLVLPLLRPAMTTVAVFTMIPIWNDLWFPLILAPGEATKTVTLGAQIFLGQYETDWNAMLAVLTVGIVPIVALYLVLSRGLIRGIASGAIK